MLLSERLFLAVLASVPIQLNKFFFPSFSFVLGIPLDYRAISLYLIDILTVVLIISVIKKPPQGFIKHLKSKKSFFYYLLVLNLYLFANAIFISESKQLSVLFALKILEFSLLLPIASYYFSQKKMMSKIIDIITISILWQSVLAVIQFAAQRSIGFYFLGERTFDTTTISIAHTQILQTQFLRPYGTFPHPNILGAFLLLFSVFQLEFKGKKAKMLTVTNITMSIALFLTFSKTALLLLLVTAGALKGKIKIMAVLVVILILAAYVYLKFLNQSYIDTIAERIVLASTALDIAKANPIFGVGSNNFTLAISRYNLTSIASVRLLQPVHNVFLLILSENGILGLLFFTFLLFKIAKSANTLPKFITVAALLIYLSVDHFLWTLEQGQLLLFLSLAFILSSQKETTS